MKYKAFALVLTLSAPLAAQTVDLKATGHRVAIAGEITAPDNRPLVSVDAECGPAGNKTCGGLYMGSRAQGDDYLALVLGGASYATQGTGETGELRGFFAGAWPEGDGHTALANALTLFVSTGGNSSADMGVPLIVAPTPANARLGESVGVLIQDQQGWGLVVEVDPTYLGGEVSLGAVPDGGTVPLCLDSGNRIARCDGDLAALLAEVRALRAEVAALKGGAR